MNEAITLTTADGVELEAERHVPDGHAADAVKATVVIAHPHPLHGGDMYSPVTSALFRALPTVGLAGVRFNFRGVGRSGGSHDGGDAERLDMQAAITEAAPLAPGAPLVLAGWSFGADVSLAVDDDRIAGWFLAAAVLRVHDPATMPARTHQAPKWFVTGDADQFAPPPFVEERIGDWVNASLHVVPNSDHFFGGLMAPVVERFTECISSLG